ncbi:TetR/AcrR family transcriptional regulator [Pseudophaeobacter sp.]|uniref:TetR/AcrR family transcriptional regulator n=1 Tax=Pseudophaeobacter sp. TaxID=1971739 RepID=UPI003299979E
MAKQMQKRTLETRARLVAVATALVEQHGFAALRTEEVVQGAGVAKGTFFAHFRDKDALMDLLIGAGIDRQLDQLEKAPAPKTVEELVALQMPLIRFMTQERYVFDVILRLSGAAAIAEIGKIATTFGRFLELTTTWFERGHFRRDIPAELQADGMQAFVTQVMALHFCALHEDQGMEERLNIYLRAWLQPIT